MPSAVYMTDTFTGADGTEIDSRNSDSGHSWTETTAFGTNNNAGKITSNALQCANSSGAQYYSSYVPQSADYSVFCDVKYNGGLSNSLATDSYTYLEARKAASNTFTTVRVRFLAESSTNNIVLRLQGVENGSTTNFSSASTGTLTSGMIFYTVAGSAGSTYRMELRMIGSTISVYLNGVLRCEGVHTGVTAAGRPAIAIGGDTTSGKAITVDNYYTVDSSSAGRRNVSQAVTRAATR